MIVCYYATRHNCILLLLDFPGNNDTITCCCKHTVNYGNKYRLGVDPYSRDHIPERKEEKRKPVDARSSLHPQHHHHHLSATLLASHLLSTLYTLVLRVLFSILYFVFFSLFSSPSCLSILRFPAFPFCALGPPRHPQLLTNYCSRLWLLRAVAELSSINLSFLINPFLPLLIHS